MSKALYAARERVKRTPGWASRLIENEEWAVKPPKRSPVGELTGRRGAELEVEEANLA
jgi:hypothetical protein